MLIIRNLNLISVQFWTYLAFWGPIFFTVSVKMPKIQLFRVTEPKN